MFRLMLKFTVLVAFLRPVSAQIMSIDLGQEFFKVALMRQGAPLEIVLNAHSARKTPTAASFMETARAFGSDALAHSGKAPAKVPVFFHTMLGDNFTSADDVKPGGSWWNRFALGTEFYSYDLTYDTEAGVPAFVVGEGPNKTFRGEQVLANIFFFAQQMAQVTADGAPVKDVVVTVPSDANLRLRQAIKSATEIAGLKLLTLVHETSGFAVQRAVDYSPPAKTVEKHLLFNLGSRKAEVSIVQFEAREAGMVAGRTAPVVNILGSAVDYSIGGHLFDLKIASVMLKKFQEKHPKFADGVAKNARALRKLINTAQKTKAVLSANKKAPFIVESLFEDTDFQASITREEFEAMCKEMLDKLTVPIETALLAANTTMSEIKMVEVVGGAWRVPKIQQILSEYIEKSSGQKLPLGQHLNGEEASALGAALVGANSSSSFRVKKIFFQDITAHNYAVQVTSIKDAWEKNMTVLYPVGGPHGGKKKLSFALEEDFKIKLFENGILVSEYEITGLAEKLEDKWKTFNMTGSPKVSVNVNLEGSGLIEVKNAVATVEESHWVNVTVTKEKPNATNATTENATEANATADANATNATAEVETETVQKLKKKKHEKKLTVSVKHYRPLPMSGDDIKLALQQFADMAQHEKEVQEVMAGKNELEAAIYGGRDKIDLEDIKQVTNEEQREEAGKLCTEYEEWMYENSNKKAEYDERLAKLRGIFDPMQERVQELEWRPDLVSDTYDSLKKMRKTLTDAKNEPSSNETICDQAEKKRGDFETWFNERVEKQKATPLHEAPAFKKSEVLKELSKTQKEFDKLIKAATKKPKKKAADATGNATAANKTEGEKTEEKKGDAGEQATGLAEAEAALKALLDKKKAAVAADDFEKANSLKAEEKELRAKIKDLKAAGEKSEL